MNIWITPPPPLPINVLATAVRKRRVMFARRIKTVSEIHDKNECVVTYALKNMFEILLDHLCDAICATSSILRIWIPRLWVSSMPLLFWRRLGDVVTFELFLEVKRFGDKVILADWFELIIKLFTTDFPTKGLRSKRQILIYSFR